jgi:hypothetical protein
MSALICGNKEQFCDKLPTLCLTFEPTQSLMKLASEYLYVQPHNHGSLRDGLKLISNELRE